MGTTHERKTTGNLGPGYDSWASLGNGSVAEATLLDLCVVNSMKEITRDRIKNVFQNCNSGAEC